MSDIIDKLRGFWGDVSNRDIIEAADEIERLREALEKIADGKRDANQSYATLFAELVREARAALQKG